MGFLAVIGEVDVLGDDVACDGVQSNSVVGAHDEEGDGFQRVAGIVAEGHVKGGDHDPRGEIGEVELLLDAHEKGAEEEGNWEDCEEERFDGGTSAHPPMLCGCPNACVDAIYAH